MKIAVLGGGILGLATARALLMSGFKDIHVFEKESSPAFHQSSRNSGVIHAGLYYKPGSLKSLLCRQGMHKMKDYCSSKNIEVITCGKLVTAVDATELARLHSLFERGMSNGLEGLQLLTRQQALSYEPNSNPLQAIHVPEEAIVDYSKVARSYVTDIKELGGSINFNVAIDDLIERETSVSLSLGKSDTFEVDYIICCAGLYGDKIAKKASLDLEGCQIVPFRGEYYVLKDKYRHLVNGLIYPVPDPQMPFLGVHLTKMLSGHVEAGPNAVLALAREGYTWSNIDILELIESLKFQGLQKFLIKNPSVSAGEFLRSLSKPIFVRSLQRLLPSIEGYMLNRSPAGVRAQLMSSEGELIQDFKIIRSRRVVSVLNAPSPAATSSLAIADHVLKFFKSL